MRVIAGELRGRRLEAPAGLDVRPTSDRAREALFDILGERVRDSRFLDLFAGSGAVGIEALSRGAAKVVLVESGRRALTSLARNLETLAIGGLVTVIQTAWPRALGAAAAKGAPFSIVFADPPYREACYPEILESVSEADLLDAGAIVVLEHERRRAMPQSAGRLHLHRATAYGRVGLAFYGAAA